MEWNNDNVLEFIELMQGEPHIWDPKCKGHKNRNIVNDAWSRIRHNFSVPCTIEELKRKRNTLLTQYRECLKKIKEATKTGSGIEDIYKPSWFAFDALHNFMGDIYKYRMTIATEAVEITDERPQSHETGSIEIFSPRPESRESYSRSGSDAFPISKRQRGALDKLIAKKEMDEAFYPINNKFNRRKNEKEYNTCDLYGQLLAEKLKPLDFDDRLVLMNEIDNLVFKYTMNVRKRNSLSTTIDMPYKSKT